MDGFRISNLSIPLIPSFSTSERELMIPSLRIEFSTRAYECTDRYFANRQARQRERERGDETERAKRLGENSCFHFAGLGVYLIQHAASTRESRFTQEYRLLLAAPCARARAHSRRQTAR
jgi:hypothetical protein